MTSHVAMEIDSTHYYDVLYRCKHFWMNNLTALSDLTLRALLALLSPYSSHSLSLSSPLADPSSLYPSCLFSLPTRIKNQRSRVNSFHFLVHFLMIYILMCLIAKLQTNSADTTSALFFGGFLSFACFTRICVGCFEVMGFQMTTTDFVHRSLPSKCTINSNESMIRSSSPRGARSSDQNGQGEDTKKFKTKPSCHGQRDQNQE